MVAAGAAAKGKGRARGKCGGLGFIPPRSIAPAATVPALHLSNFLIAPKTVHVPACPVDVDTDAWSSVCGRGVRFANSKGPGQGVCCCACDAKKRKRAVPLRGLDGLRNHATAMVEIGSRDKLHTALLSFILLDTPPAPAPAPAEPTSSRSATAPALVNRPFKMPGPCSPRASL